IISDKLEWIAAEKADMQGTERDTLQNAIENWRVDWVSQNTDQYLSHYSKNFFYHGGGLSKWSDYKRGIQAGKPKVSVHINDVSMFSYPIKESGAHHSNAEPPMVVVNFEQDFKSPALQNKMRKRQYWQYENNQWKIIYEGAA
ncbi:MAG: L,D-transpeptidase Cds6 family protein, partial [Methylophilaceae bacterium]